MASSDTASKYSFKSQLPRTMKGLFLATLRLLVFVKLRKFVKMSSILKINSSSSNYLIMSEDSVSSSGMYF